MVNAIDLRIGNWVDIPGRIYANCDDVCIDAATSNGAKSIPLNTELLLAFNETFPLNLLLLI